MMARNTWWIKSCTTPGAQSVAIARIWVSAGLSPSGVAFPKFIGMKSNVACSKGRAPVLVSPVSFWQGTPDGPGILNSDPRIHFCALNRLDSTQPVALSPTVSWAP